MAMHIQQFVSSPSHRIAVSLCLILVSHTEQKKIKFRFITILFKGITIFEIKEPYIELKMLPLGLPTAANLSAHGHQQSCSWP